MTNALTAWMVSTVLASFPAEVPSMEQSMVVLCIRPQPGAPNATPSTVFGAAAVFSWAVTRLPAAAITTVAEIRSLMKTIFIRPCECEVKPVQPACPALCATFRVSAAIMDAMRAVLKLGSSVLSGGTDRLHRPRMVDLIRQIVAIYDNYQFDTQVLAASLRGPVHVIESALAGAHIGTMPYKTKDMLFNHPLTDKGLEQFLADHAKALTK